MMGWFSAVIERRTLRSWGIVAIVGAIAMAVVMLVGMRAAFASHPEVSLTGSDFEIDTDANLKVDDPPPSIDWANVDATVQPDKSSGATDDSFGQGAKEDTRNPTVVDGSIPPNKSDLLNFGVYLETTATGHHFLHVFWHRVQEPSGTTNMDFEFNQSDQLAGNGVTPQRTKGDLLIQYDLSQGGTHPVLWVSKWVTTGNSNQCQAANSTPCWGKKQNFTDAGAGTGSINTSPISAANASPLTAAISPRTFGEASIDFDALSAGSSTTCTSFGSAYLKSRSSDSFTAALKDFIAPTPVDVTNCGSIKITKTDDADNPLEGAVFTLFTDNLPLDGAPPHGAEDTATAQTCTTDDTGVCTIKDVPKGQYWVVETTTPAGYDTAADQNVIITADEEESLTFVDPRQHGAIQVHKVRKHAADGSGDHPQSGVDFTVDGVTHTTDANGNACFDDLAFDDYTVSETVPDGYNGEADKTVTVDNKASCDGTGGATSTDGEQVTFHNTPLTDLSVSVDSQIDGGTASTIECTDSDNASVASGTTDANGDGSASASDLEPGTYTCEVVIDP